MAALDEFPCVMLPGAVPFFFARMPADRRGIKQNLRPLQRRETRAFGIPLVPANQSADLCVFRLPRFETEIAGCEIELFEVQRVVGNVHLAVDAEQRTVGVDDRRRIVIDAGRPLFEQGGNDHDLVLLRELLKRGGAFARDRFGEPEVFMVRALAEIL